MGTRAARPARLRRPSQPRPRTSRTHGSRSSSGRAARSVLGPGRAPRGRCADDLADARLGSCDERGPARVAVLAREHQLRAGEDRLAAVEPRERVGIALARGLDELLRLLAKLLQVHHDLLRRGPVSASSGGRRDRVDACRCDEVGSALPADRMRPRTRIAIVSLSWIDRVRFRRSPPRRRRTRRHPAHAARRHPDAGVHARRYAGDGEGDDPDELRDEPLDARSSSATRITCTCARARR